MARQRERWEVEWVDADDLKRELAKVDKHGHPVWGEGEMCEAMMNCYVAKFFTTEAAAVAFAKKILPKDAAGEVRITRQACRQVDTGDDGPALFDWDDVGKSEFVTH